jgi:hypothetical protein
MNDTLLNAELLDCGVKLGAMGMESGVSTSGVFCLGGHCLSRKLVGDSSTVFIIGGGASASGKIAWRRDSNRAVTSGLSLLCSSSCSDI